MIHLALGCMLFVSAAAASAADLPPQQVSPFATDSKTSPVADLPLPGGFTNPGEGGAPNQAFDLSAIEVVFIRAGSASLRIPAKDTATSGNASVNRYRAIEVTDGQKVWINGRQLHARVYSSRVTLSFACNGKSECGIAWEGELSAPTHYSARSSASQKSEGGAKNPATLPAVGITWSGSPLGAATSQSMPSAPR